MESENIQKLENDKKKLVAEKRKNEIEIELNDLNQKKKKAIEQEDFSLAQQCKIEIGTLQKELDKVQRLLELFSSSTSTAVSQVLPNTIMTSPTTQRKKLPANSELVQAASSGRLPRMKELIENQRVDINSIDFNTGDTALHVAALNGIEQIVKYLVDNGADCNIQNRAGRTPLAILIEKRAHQSLETQARWEGMAMYMMEFGGADLFTKDEEGKTPLSFADSNYQTRLRGFLSQLHKKYRT